MFSSFFDVENPLLKFLSRLVDIAVLNILFVISCIPIFTIGTALSSMYYIVITGWDSNNAHILSKYVKAFKENFKKSTVIWLIMLALGLVVLVGGYTIALKWKAAGEPSVNPMVIVYILFTIVYAAVFTYVWPLQGKFENTIGATFRNAFVMAVTNLMETILAWMLFAIAAYLMLTVTFFRYAGLAFMFAVLACLQGLLFRKVFAPYLAEAEAMNKHAVEKEEEGFENSYAEAKIEAAELAAAQEAQKEKTELEVPEENKAPVENSSDGVEKEVSDTPR